MYVLRHIVWEPYLELLNNVLPASLLSDFGDYGAVKGGAIIAFVRN